MARQHNNAGRIRLAQPSVTTALAFDPDKHDPTKPDSWPHMKAEDYDPDKHKHLKFFCPDCADKGKIVQLKRPTKPFLQNIPFDVVHRKSKKPVRDHLGNPVTENRRYEIPARFTLYPKQKHECNAGDKQARFAAEVRASGGTTLNSADNVRLVNLNIPAGQKADPHVPPAPSAAEPFRMAGTPKRRIHAPQDRKSQKHSTGVTSVKQLATLLDETEDQKDLRDTTIVRNGSLTIGLSELYLDNTLDLYRRLFVLERREGDAEQANHNHMALFRFEPEGNKSKFWRRTGDHSITVTSKTATVRDRDGDTFNVAVRLNFATHEAYDAFRAAYATAEKDEQHFLIYSEEATVDTAACEAAKQAVVRRRAKTANVFIDATIHTPSQIMQWMPKSERKPEIDDRPDAGPQGTADNTPEVS